MLFYVFAQLLFSSLDPCVICIGLLLCSTTELLLYNYTALGVAFLAGLATGFWKDISDLKKLWIEDMSFHPDTSFKSNDIIELWQNRINRLLKVNE